MADADTARVFRETLIDIYNNGPAPPPPPASPRELHDAAIDPLRQVADQVLKEEKSESSQEGEERSATTIIQKYFQPDTRAALESREQLRNSSDREALNRAHKESRRLARRGKRQAKLAEIRTGNLGGNFP